MLVSTAQRLYDSDTTHTRRSLRVWRPFAPDVSDLLCVESPPGDTGPWMHAAPAIALIPSPAIVRLESRRSVHVTANTILLVPELHAYSVRPVERGTSHPTLTLLIGSRPRLDAEAAGRLPAVNSLPDHVAALSRLGAELVRPVRSFDIASDLPSLLKRLLAASTSVPYARMNSSGTPLLPVRDYLRAHLGEPISTATLARMAGLTESHCIRSFHYEFGLPPHAYHLRLRLARASELLARGQSVSTVAYDCGFADQSHLSRKFKEVYDVAPGMWASATNAHARLVHASSGRLGPQSLMRRDTARRYDAERCLP